MARLLDISFKDDTNLQQVIKEMPVAASRALNRTATSARSMASREIRDVYNIKKADLDPNIGINKANRTKMVATIITRGKPFPLSRFAARQTKRGVTVAIKRGSRKLLRGTFLSTMASGHEGVFVRKGRARLPITERMTISIAQMFASMGIRNKVVAHITENLPKELKHEVDAIQKGYVKP